MRGCAWAARFPRVAAACFALVVAPCFPPVAAARDVYVDNLGGDDVQDGSAPRSTSQGQGPCRTIAKALRVARAGDRVVLAPTGEPYRESVCLHGGRNSGLGARPFILEGNGQILEGADPTPPDRWEHVRGDVFRYRPQLLSHQMLFREAKPLPRRAVDAPGLPPPLEPLEWRLFDQTIHFRVEPEKPPREYALSHAARRVGVTFYEVHDVLLRDLIVQGFQLDGVNAHDNAFRVRLVDVTLRGNGRSGLSVGGASRLEAVGCLIGNNGTVQARVEGRARAKLIDCAVLDNTAPAIDRDGGEIELVGGDK